MMVGSNWEGKITLNLKCQELIISLTQPTCVRPRSSKFVNKSRTLITPREAANKKSTTSNKHITCLLQDEGTSNLATELQDLLNNLEEGLCVGNAPQPITEGEGGSYMMFNKKKEVIAIFKPQDEEPASPSNPKRHQNSPNRDGIKDGEGAVRECAAYQLDHNHVAGVPLTTMVEIRHPYFGSKTKIGSVQKWCSNSGPAGEFGSNGFTTDNVHAIATLDLRLLNTDRHDGNLLVVEEGKKKKLLPIDHGFALPAVLGESFFAWMYWNQAKEPFSASTLEYIQNLDIEHDTRLLAKLGVSEGAIKNMRMSSMLLKRGAEFGLTAYDIATIVCRFNETPSQLEILASKAKEKCLQGGDFYAHFSSLLDEALKAKM